MKTDVDVSSEKVTSAWERVMGDKPCDDDTCDVCRLSKAVVGQFLGIEMLSILAADPGIGMVALIMTGIRLGQESAMPPGPLN